MAAGPYQCCLPSSTEPDCVTQLRPINQYIVDSIAGSDWQAQDTVKAGPLPGAAGCPRHAPSHACVSQLVPNAPDLQAQACASASPYTLPPNPGCSSSMSKPWLLQFHVIRHAPDTAKELPTVLLALSAVALSRCCYAPAHTFARGIPHASCSGSTALGWGWSRAGACRWASLRTCATCRGTGSVRCAWLLESCLQRCACACTKLDPSSTSFVLRLQLGPPNIVAELASGKPMSLMLMLPPDPD